MSTPNAPQGSPLEQAAKGSSLAAKITFITLAHLAVIGGGLVFYGCSKNTPPDSSNTGASTNTTATLNPSDVVSPAPFADTNTILAPAETNPTAPIGGTPATGQPLSPATGISPEVGAGAGPVSPVVNPSSPLTTPLPVTTPEAPLGGGAGTSEYKVQKGDTGASIAKKHGVSLSALKAANPAVNWTKLKITQSIQIPAGSTAPTPSTDAVEHTPAAAPVVHVVKPNDTLTSISKKYGVPWKQIRAANGLKSETIKVGDKLKIPAKKDSHAAKPAASAPSAPAPAIEPPAGSAIAPLSPLPLTPEPSAQPLQPRPSGNPPR